VSTKIPHARDSRRYFPVRLLSKRWKYRRSLPLTFMEIKTFSRLRGDFNMFFQSHLNTETSTAAVGINLNTALLHRANSDKTGSKRTGRSRFRLVSAVFTQNPEFPDWSATRKYLSSSCHTLLDRSRACRRPCAYRPSGHRHSDRDH
jgi:hypothetical protein